MRGSEWTPRSKAAFESSLSGLVRYPTSANSDETLGLSFRSPPGETPPDSLCSVVEVSSVYQVDVAPLEVVAELDRSLSAALSASSSIFVSGIDAADAFWTILAGRNLVRDIKTPGQYFLLIYNPDSVPPQHGYQAEAGAPPETFGVALDQRFAFLDMGSRPHILEDFGELTPNELLMTTSRSSEGYAEKLRAIAADFFSPKVSANMQRFPRQNRLSFSLSLIDADAIIRGLQNGEDGSKAKSNSVGATFSPKTFTELVQGTFQDFFVTGNAINFEVETVNVMENSKVSMAVSRAFSEKGLQLVLDSERLFKDIVADESSENGLLMDASLVTHIPIFLFSFADEARVCHFEDGEEVRAKTVGNRAVFMVENRLRDVTGESTTLTMKAVIQVLEMLGGLNLNLLSTLNGEKGRLPLLLRDVIHQNIVRQELDWSASTAARRASEALEYDDLDESLIPLKEGRAIADSRVAVDVSLKELHAAWDRAASTLSSAEVAASTQDLVEKSNVLTRQLHHEFCNQPILSEEILITARRSSHAVRTHLRWMLLGICLGVMAGALSVRRRMRKTLGRTGALGDDRGASLPLNSLNGDGLSQPTSVWFSTLVSDKRKVS